MDGEEFTTAMAYYRPFPKAEDVFANRVEEHRRYLLPAGLLQLNRFFPGEKGWIPFLIPIEPTSGNLAERSEPYHNYYCRFDWFACRQVGEKWEFAADFRYFHKAYFESHPPTTDDERQEVNELADLYERSDATFDDRARQFHKIGWLPSDRTELSPARDADRCRLVCNLGGTSYEANWSNPPAWKKSIPLAKDPNDGGPNDSFQVVPLTEDGRKFRYLGELESWYYTDATGVVKLFYDPVERIALFTLDWT